MGDILLRWQVRNAGCVTSPSAEVHGRELMEDFQWLLSALMGYANDSASQPFSLLVPELLWLHHARWHIVGLGQFAAYNWEVCWKAGWHPHIPFADCGMGDVAGRELCVVCRRRVQYRVFTVQPVFMDSVGAFPVPVFNFHTKCSLFENPHHILLCLHDSEWFPLWITHWEK